MWSHFSRFIDNWNNYGQLTVWHLTNTGNWPVYDPQSVFFSDRKKCVLCKLNRFYKLKIGLNQQKSVFCSTEIYYIYIYLFRERHSRPHVSTMAPAGRTQDPFIHPSIQQRNWLRNFSLCFASKPFDRNIDFVTTISKLDNWNYII